MVFSSHRFGNLTRHADLILCVWLFMRFQMRTNFWLRRLLCRYMNDSVVVEAGTHDELLKKQGEYARIWMMQAQAFL